MAIDTFRNHAIWGQYPNYHENPIVEYDTVQACGEWTWIDGNTYTSDTVASYAIPDTVCEHEAILILTIYPTYEVEDYMNLCPSVLPMTYGGSIFDETTTSGNYAVMMTSQQGCDSLIVLGVTVHKSEETPLQMVTVENNFCKVMWQKQAAVEGYNIYREAVGAASYDLVHTAAFNDVSYWVDSVSMPMNMSYRYKITSVDSCGVESPLSESHATIHLIMADGEEKTHTLQWTPYEGASFASYNIYRGATEQEQELIASVPAGNTSYSDNDEPNANVYYTVAAVLEENDANTVAEVRSNTVSHSEVGIDVFGNGTQTWQVRAERGMLIVQGAEGKMLYIYDAYGRLLKQIDHATEEERYEVSTAGLYIVKMQGSESKKITVLK